MLSEYLLTFLSQQCAYTCTHPIYMSVLLINHLTMFGFLCQQVLGNRAQNVSIAYYYSLSEALICRLLRSYLSKPSLVETLEPL